MRLPLRLRLTLGFGLGMALVLSALGFFLFARLGSDLTASVDMGLRSRAQVISSAIGRQQATLVDARARLIDPDEAFAQVLSSSGIIVDTSSGVAQHPMLSERQLGSISVPTFFNERVAGVGDPVRLLAVPQQESGQRVFVVVGSTLGDRNDALHRLLLLFAIAGPAALVVTSFAGWVLAGAALRPVERMRREAAAISVVEPERRLPTPPGNDELARLGSTLNSMLDRLQGAFERERRFVENASHELRTPLTVLKAELGLALARSRSADELEAALRSGLEETEHLVRLAEDLLILARAEDGRLELRREPVQLDDFLSRTCAAHEARTSDVGLRIEVIAPRETVPLDPIRFRQAIENLLDNSLRHTPAGGRIEVRAVRANGTVRVTVDDSGTGFPDEMLDHAFEPFAHRAAGTGSGGLGLAIVRAVAEAHGGTARVSNRPEGGARVILDLKA